MDQYSRSTTQAPDSKIETNTNSQDISNVQHPLRKDDIRDMTTTNKQELHQISPTVRKRKDIDLSDQMQPTRKSGKYAVFETSTAKAIALRPEAETEPLTDGHIRVSVNSLTIPEVDVNLLDSATIESLKVAIVDVAMKLLAGELKLGVQIHGQEITDESATLSQIGISQDKASNLGFTLESATQASTSSENDPLLILLKADAQRDPNSRSPIKFVPRAPRTNLQFTNDLQTLTVYAPSEPLAADKTDQGFKIKSGLVPVPVTLTDGSISASNETTGSIGAIGIENPPGPIALLNSAIRRTRRPFSIAEVESLLHAVEQLGTGRWKDVKRIAFEDSNHRTHVDLKDKWKTLVHTAEIAPHKRRGDQIPQELLDRVVAANTYWTARQAQERNQS